jgi:hypothetical protein
VRNYHPVNHRAIYLDSGLVYKVVSSHCCLLILQSNTEIWLNAPNYFTVRELNGINMKKILTASLISAFLVGCGSDDKNNGLDVDLSQFKGSESVISISSGGAVSDGDQLVINKTVTGTVGDDTYTTFNFNHSSDELVTARLSSAVENLDFTINGGEVRTGSYGAASDEAVVFYADASQNYSVDVDSYSGGIGGEFDLTLSETTRHSLGLIDNEYLVSYSQSYSRKCSDDETPAVGTARFIRIFNFNDGYIETISGVDSINFSQVSGYSFTLAYSTTATETDDRESSGSSTYTLNPEAGTLTGSGKEIYSYTSNGSVVTCNSSAIYNGEIIL